VPTITLADILALAGHREIHWLKIDVEGMEELVLQGMDQVKNRPWILVIECIAPMSKIKVNNKWESKLERMGYTLAFFDGINQFFLDINRNNLMRHFLHPVNTFDCFKIKK